MTGLIVKDLLVSVKTIKAYVMVIGLYTVMAILDIFDFSFVSSFISIMLIMLPIGAFAYDEQAKWDRYALAMPLGRRRVVGARYLFALVISLSSAVIASLLGGVAAVMGNGSLLECAASSFATMGMGLTMVDILLPLCYKLGPERSRPYLYALIFLPMIVFFLAFRMGVRVDLSWLDRLGESSPAALMGLVGLLPLAGLAAMVPSWLISCRVVEHKEF